MRHVTSSYRYVSSNPIALHIFSNSKAAAKKSRWLKGQLKPIAVYDDVGRKYVSTKKN